MKFVIDNPPNPLKTTTILSHLSQMEMLLKEYSYEELNSRESLGLKKTFQAFKNELEESLFAPKRLESVIHQDPSFDRVAVPKCGTGPNPSSISLKSTVVPSLPIFDLSEFKEESRGDYIYLVELVRLFKQNVTEFIGAYSVHLNNADWENLAFSARKIKAGLSMVQADSLLGCLKKLDEFLHSCNTHDINQLQALKKRFIQEYVRVEAAISAELALMGKEEQ